MDNPERLPKFAERVDHIINLPFDVARPFQTRFSTYLGEHALSAAAKGHSWRAAALARSCEVTACRAGDAVDVASERLGSMMRPDSIDVVPVILEFNQERTAA